MDGRSETRPGGSRPPKEREAASREKASRCRSPDSSGGDGAGAPRRPSSRGRFNDDGIRQCFYAILPEHVIANVMVLPSQAGVLRALGTGRGRLQSPALHLSWRRGRGVRRWCVKHRSELMMTLNRMSFGYYGGSDVMIDRMPDLSVRIRFSPTIASQFDFREIVVVQERTG